VEGCEKPGAALIAGEHPPGAIAAVRRRREADDQQTRVRIAKAGQRARPVRLTAVAPRRVRARRFAMRDEPGAATAAHDLGGKVPQRGSGLQS
jgi:hypothetical protein